MTTIDRWFFKLRVHRWKVRRVFLALHRAGNWATQHRPWATSCPRRLYEFGPWDHEEGLDHWRRDHTCSFCGGLDPEVFLGEVEHGATVTPTDKDYKAYMNPGHRKVYFQHMTEQQKERFVALFNSRRMQLEYPGHFYVPPFFTRSRGGSSAEGATHGR